MHEKICDIQNGFWKAYKDFMKSGDMKKYNEDLDIIFGKYENDGYMLNFCKSLLIAWTPVVNKIKEEM